MISFSAHIQNFEGAHRALSFSDTVENKDGGVGEEPRTANVPP